MHPLCKGLARDVFDGRPQQAEANVGVGIALAGWRSQVFILQVVGQPGKGLGSVAPHALSPVTGQPSTVAHDVPGCHRLSLGKAAAHAKARQHIRQRCVQVQAPLLGQLQCSQGSEHLGDGARTVTGEFSGTEHAVGVGHAVATGKGHGITVKHRHAEVGLGVSAHALVQPMA